MVGYKDTEFTSSHKYIKTCTYTWDSSHRTPTEHWQKVSETQKCKNDLHIDLHDPDNHDGVNTHLEPDILECEVKWALGSITMNLKHRLWA